MRDGVWGGEEEGEGWTIRYEKGEEGLSVGSEGVGMSRLRIGSEGADERWKKGGLLHAHTKATGEYGRRWGREAKMDKTHWLAAEFLVELEYALAQLFRPTFDLEATVELFWKQRVVVDDGLVDLGLSRWKEGTRAGERTNR
jgi:hypothetical protein